MSVQAELRLKVPGPRGDLLARGKFNDFDKAIEETRSYFWQSGTNPESVRFFIDGVEVKIIL